MIQISEGNETNKDEFLLIRWFVLPPGAPFKSYAQQIHSFAGLRSRLCERSLTRHFLGAGCRVSLAP